MSGARADAGQRVGDATAGVIVAMDSNPDALLAGVDRATAGHPERGDLGVAEALSLEQLEQLQLLGIGARKAGLNEVDPKLVEAVRNAQLLLRGEGHALSLHAVTKGRVVELDLGHRRNSSESAKQASLAQRSACFADRFRNSL